MMQDRLHINHTEYTFNIDLYSSFVALSKNIFDKQVSTKLYVSFYGVIKISSQLEQLFSQRKYKLKYLRY